jgi:hypothetical protein
MNIKDRILWKKFCDEVLGKLSEDHQFIAKKENFKKMFQSCQLMIMSIL